MRTTAHRFTSLAHLSLLLLPTLALTGCSDSKDGVSAEAVGTTGLQLSSDLTGKSDVTSIRFRLTPVDCETGSPTGDPLVSDRPLEDFTIPGGIDELENAPLDHDSAHVFADHFADVPAGCYDVEALPLGEGSEGSLVCLPAWKDRVEVLEGQTTEVLLINQCHGKDPGALDAIAALNHEPEMSVEFAESKFVRCESPQVICATASDPDGDPLEFSWQLDAASPAASGPAVLSREVDSATGAVTECVEYVPTGGAGRYDITLGVYDLVWRDGSLIRVEDWLALEGYPSESHTEFDFFFYAGGCDGTEEPVERYDIDLSQLSAVSDSVDEAFVRAAERWESHVVGDLPDISIVGIPAGACGVPHPPIDGTIDDLRIYSSIVSIDGPGGILGSAGPCVLRADSGLPIVGVMQFDSADLASLESGGLLSATILHEMAHVLGVGSLWSHLGYLANPSVGLPPGFADAHFTGAQARVAFDAAGGLGYFKLKVPAENEYGGTGTRDAHWRESVFGNELMTGFIDPASNPLSRVTVASLADMGYSVSFAGVDSYSLPGSALRSSAADDGVSLEDDAWDGPIFTVDDDGQIEQLKH